VILAEIVSVQADSIEAGYCQDRLAIVAELPLCAAMCVSLKTEYWSICAICELSS
jgi:hypothetical protein